MNDAATATTLIPPAKECSCGKDPVSYAAWMAHPSRRPWSDLGLEIIEHTCRSTISVEVNAIAVRVAA